MSAAPLLAGGAPAVVLLEPGAVRGRGADHLQASAGLAGDDLQVAVAGVAQLPLLVGPTMASSAVRRDVSLVRVVELHLLSVAEDRTVRLALPEMLDISTLSRQA
jgi:hypothetical protein